MISQKKKAFFIFRKTELFYIFLKKFFFYSKKLNFLVLRIKNFTRETSERKKIKESPL